MTTGPLGQGLSSAVGMAMAARRERGLFDPDAAPGESPFDHFIYVIASDGDIEEGVTSEAVRSPAGRGSATSSSSTTPTASPSRTTPTSRCPRTPPRATRRTAGTPRWSRAARTSRASWPRSTKAKKVTDRAVVHRAPHGHRLPGAEPSMNTGKAHGSALGADEVAATKKILGFDPDKSFEVDALVIEHTRRSLDRGAAAKADWQTGLRRLGGGEPGAQGAVRPAAGRELAGRLGATACRPGTSTRRASPPGPRPARCWPRWPTCCPSCGAARRTWPSRTTPRWRAPTRFGPIAAATKRLERAALRPDPALRHPRARDGLDPDRHRDARPDPPVRRHVPGVLRLHARRGPAGRR